MHQIPFYPGYYLTEDFQILGKSGRPLSQCGKHYKYVNVVTPEGNTRNGILYVHRAIALVHVPGYFEGALVDHIDRNPTNNSIENLRWVTPRENYLNRGEVRFGATMEEIDARIQRMKEEIVRLEEIRNRMQEGNA